MAKKKAGTSSLLQMERFEHTDVNCFTLRLVKVYTLIIWTTHYIILKEKYIMEKEYIDTYPAPQNRPFKSLRSRDDVTKTHSIYKIFKH